MNSVLDELYLGNINPDELIYPKDKEYREINKKISAEMELWKNKLTKEDYYRLEDLRGLIAQACSVELRQTFRYGFKLGALLMIETFTGREEPVYD